MPNIPLVFSAICSFLPSFLPRKLSLSIILSLSTSPLQNYTKHPLLLLHSKLVPKVSYPTTKMNYWPTTALYLTAAEAAISQLSPPPPPAAVADRRKSPSDAHDYPQELVTPSEVTILIVILSIIISVVALNCAIRCFLKDFSRDRGRRRWERKKAAELSAAVAAVTSTVKYKGGGDEEEAASASAECAICLAEFEEGEEIKVVGNCRHRFHGRCIERWFATSRNSLCPTCRQSCLPPATQASPVVASSPIVANDDG